MEFGVWSLGTAEAVPLQSCFMPVFYSLFAGDEVELDEELPESEEVDAGLSADFESDFVSDFESEDLLSPSAEAFIEARFDLEA